MSVWLLPHMRASSIAYFLLGTWQCIASSRLDESMPPVYSSLEQTLSRNIRIYMLAVPRIQTPFINGERSFTCLKTCDGYQSTMPEEKSRFYWTKKCVEIINVLKYVSECSDAPKTYSNLFGFFFRLHIVFFFGEHMKFKCISIKNPFGQVTLFRLYSRCGRVWSQRFSQAQQCVRRNQPKNHRRLN